MPIGRAPAPTITAMRFAVIAQRSTATNEALAGAAATLGLDSAVLPPRDALRFLEPGGVALGRLDVREGWTESRAGRASSSGWPKRRSTS